MGETPQIRKFMFDRSFDEVAVVKPAVEEKPSVTMSEEELEAIKKQAIDSGFAAGRQLTLEEQGQQLNAIVAHIASQIGKLFEQTEADRQAKEHRVRDAVLAIARKILPDFNKRHGLQEIEAVVAGIVGEMNTEPRLVVRVNEAQFDAINASVKSITSQQAFAGKVVLLADENIRPNDCLVEWADGGIERNLEALWKNVGQAVAPAVQSTQPPSPSEETKNG